MLEQRRKIGLVDLLLLFIIASLTFLIIPAWIPMLRKGWQLLIVATLVVLAVRHQYINAKAMFPLVVYALIVCLNAISGDAFVGSTTNAINEVMMLFVPSALALYCTTDSGTSFSKWLFRVTWLFLLIELVSSFIVLETQPGIIRGMHAMARDESDPAYMFAFYRLGLLDYSMAHAIPILIPPLICYFKEGSTRTKILCSLLIAMCFFLTWIAESTTAIMLTILMIVLGLWVNTKASFGKNTRIIGFMVILSIVVMSSDTIMMGLLDTASYLVGDESSQTDKIDELRMSLVEGQTTGDLGSRMDLYQTSIKQFLGSPIIGTNLQPGRHSSLLDKLATLGLVGFIPLALFFWYYLKSIWKSIRPQRRIYYLECVTAAFLMLLFKGMWVWPIFLFLFMVTPSMLMQDVGRNNHIKG